MSNIGHNEKAIRLAALAGNAQVALDKVSRGESDAIEGWIAYGAALNEGRALFPGDSEFGKWVAENALSQVGTGEIKRDDRIAAMWAAANADQFVEAREVGGARTVRGIHDKWKKIEAEREKEAKRQAEQEARKKAEAEALAAREEAAAQAKVEEDARKQAETATTDAERDEAMIRAKAAAEAKEEAERDVELAEQAAAEKPEQPDPHAKLRKEFRAMTDEAQEEDWIGLREEVAELRKRVAKQRSEIADLKAKIKELTSADDAGRKIGNLQRRLNQSEGRSAEHQTNAARLQRQVNAQKAQIDILKRKLESQEIVL